MGLAYLVLADRGTLMRAQEVQAATVDVGLEPPAASASLHDGAHTCWALPSRRRVFKVLRGRCLPHRKQDMVPAWKSPALAKGEPPSLTL